MPYDKNQPPVEAVLSPKCLENLPMFNPLRYRAAIPLDTIFPQSPFFQAQGSLLPLRKVKCPGKQQPRQGL